MQERTEECTGQLVLICEQCEGERVIRSDDTPTEVCDHCDGTGIDPDAAFIAVAVRGFWREARHADADVDALRLRFVDHARACLPSPERG